jgi:hypothetical protein
MGGTVPLLPLFAFMTWTGRILSQNVSLPSRHAAVFRLAVYMRLERHICTSLSLSALRGVQRPDRACLIVGRYILNSAMPSGKVIWTSVCGVRVSVFRRDCVLGKCLSHGWSCHRHSWHNTEQTGSAVSVV